MIKNKQQNRIDLELKFRQMARGKEVSLDEVQRTLKCDCGRSGKHSESLGYSIASRAARFIERETFGQLVIRWDREKSAWRALKKEEIPTEADKNFKQIRKKSKATARMSQAAIDDGLTGIDRDRCVVAVTTANLIHLVASARARKKSVQMVTMTGVNAITQDQAIELLQARKKSPKKETEKAVA